MSRDGHLEAHVNHMFDMLYAAPDGLTLQQMALMMNVSVDHTGHIVQMLRDELADDTINVPCDPDPANPRGPHLYRLVGSMDAASPWLARRVLYCERAIRTTHAIASSLTNGLDGRSKQGRRARLLKKGLGRLIEDLDELNNS